MTVPGKIPFIPALAFLIAVLSSPALADRNEDPHAYAIPNTQVLTLRSETGKRDYELYVRLPIGYESGKDRYRVLYLLDAEYSFAIASGIVRHLEERDNIEPLILVGIAYPDKGRDSYRRNRTRDYTPTHSAGGDYGRTYQRLSGGGPEFLKILKTELIPEVDRRFRTQPGERGIVGHSYGGLFATFALVADPTVFNRYIIVSPSYWYDGKVIFRLEEEQSRHRKDLAADVFIAVGTYENQPENGRAMVDDVEAFADRLAARDDKSLGTRVRILPDETHNTVFPNALSWGLRAHYWRSPHGG